MSSADFKYRIGYWWSEKKSQKLNASELTNLFAERQCQLVKIDLDKPLEDQGPFSLIVHKISDIVVKADQGDANAKKAISAFENYVRKHPQTVILDPLDNNRILLDRYKQYRLIDESRLALEGVIFTPPFVHLTSNNIYVNRGRIRRSKITFPLVCKPILAQGSTGAHQMCIIFNEAGLKDVKPPCVAQSFVNHNARLFKLFVIKNKYYIMERPSLKNFQAGGRETVFFFSHDISKPNSSSSLTELDELDKRRLGEMISKFKAANLKGAPTSNTHIHGNTSEKGNDHTDDVVNRNDSDESCSSSGSSRGYSRYQCERYSSSSIDSAGDSDLNNSKHYNPLLFPSHDRLAKIVEIFSSKLGLTFYGIDIIIENETSRYAIIDMNTFPGYDGVENFLTILRDVVCDAVPKDVELQSQSMSASTMTYRRKPTEIDSGIEST